MDDLSEVHPAEVEEAPHLSARELPASGVEERGRHRLEVERDVVVLQPQEVLALLERAVLDRQEDGQDELGERVPFVFRVPALWFIERISRDEDARDMSPARVRRAERRWNPG
ncbi:MAG: hypothetical protein IPN32_18725 [Deltaproteobacteria bacterium]|nr:hypothetical protein [Deltaproteobacteria bacterium]